jgi:hypothetical protein
VPGIVTVGGAALAFAARVLFRRVDPVAGQVDRPVAVVPRVSVTLDRTVQYARAGAPVDRVLRVHLQGAGTVAAPVTVRLALPAGLVADSAARAVTLAGPDARATVAFRLRGVLAAGQHVVRVVAEVDGARFASGYQLVDYPHIRPQRLFRPAAVALEAVDVRLPERARVAYVPGVSDNVAPALADLGLDVAVLDPPAWRRPTSRGSRTWSWARAPTRRTPPSAANNARLLAWVRGGGTMVVQYGQYEMTRPA